MKPKLKPLIEKISAQAQVINQTNPHKMKTSKLSAVLSMKNLLTTAAALIFIASAPVLNAQTVLNGDFSSPDVGTTYNSSVPTDFTGEAGFSGGVISSSEYSSLPYSQPQYLYVNVPQPSGSGAPGGIDGIYQDLGALKPLTAYTVTVAESAGSAGGSGATYGAGGLGSTFELDLYNGTDNSTTPVATTDTVLGAAYMMTGAFTDETVTFDTGAVVKGDLTSDYPPSMSRNRTMDRTFLRTCGWRRRPSGGCRPLRSRPPAP
jgi:hypothetical protein